MPTRGRTQQLSEAGRRSPSAPPALGSEDAPQETVPQEGSPGVSQELLLSILADHKQEAVQRQQELREEMSAMQNTLARSLQLLTERLNPQPQDTPEPELPVRPPTPAHVPFMRASEPLSSVTALGVSKDKLRSTDFPKFGHEEKQDIDDWVEQVNAIYQYSGADESQLLKVLPRILEGEALEWFTDLGTRRIQYNTWMDWQKALLNAFRAPNYKEKMHVKLNRRRLRDDESMSQYFQAKMHLINKRFGDQLPAGMVIEEIMTGIPSIMHSFIQASKGPNPSVESFRRTLMELEDGLRTQQAASPRRSPPQGQQRSGRQPQNNRSNNRPYQGAQQQQQQRYPERNNSNNQRSYPAATNNAPPAPPASAICYNCNRTGHYSKDCKAPRRNNASNMNNSQASQQNQWRNPATNSNAVDLPFNRYGEEEAQEVDTSVNVITTRSKAAPPPKEPSPPQHEDPIPSAVPAHTMETITLVPNKDKERKGVPHHFDKQPATTVIQLNGKPGLHKACIDSGSSISLIDANYLKKHCPDLVPQDCSNFVINSLGAGSQAWSYVDMPVWFKGPTSIVSVPLRFYISPFAHTKIILGNDLLDSYDAILDFAAHTLHFAAHPNQTFPLQAQQKIPAGLKTAPIRAKEAYTIQPHTVANIATIKDHSLSNSNLYVQAIEPKEGQPMAGILPGITTDNEQGIVQFVNASATAVDILPQQVIGTSSPCQHPVTAAVNSTQHEQVTPEVMADCKEFADLVEELNIFGSKLTISQKEKVLNMLVRHRKAFAYGNRPIGHTTWATFSVDTGDAAPISQPPYHASPAGRKAIDETLIELLDLDVIEECTSPWGSPVVLVKQGDKIRFCVDYRKFNSVTKKDQWPIPRIDDILAAFSGKKYFSTFDANKGFHQIGVATKEDMDKLAFRTHRGQYRFKRMPFGVCNGPSAFQRLADQILGSSKWQYALVYIDDIIVFSETFDDHLEHIGNILKRVIASGITLSLSKSHLAKDSIQALGHTVSNLGIGTSPHNVEAIIKFPTPRNLKELQRLLGMAVYYRKFVPNFSSKVAPLYKLLRKDAQWEWGPPQDNAVEIIKTALTTEPVLAHPDFTRPFILHTDASTTGLGAILSQLGGDGKEHPICFISTSLSPAEKNYSATELECLAVVWALRKLHAYLDGSRFELITDHSALQWLFNFKGNNRRLSKWMLELQHHQPNMTITYRPGRIHSNVDPLSRAPLPVDTANIADVNTADTTPSTDVLNISTLDMTTTLQWIKDNVSPLYKDDKYFSVIWNTLQQGGQLPPHWQNFSLRNNLLWRTIDGCIRLCIPEDHKIRTALLQDYHDAPISGHLGRNKTYNRISGSYWWPNLAHDVRDYVNSCASCQQNKSSNLKPPGLLNPLETPAKRWHTVAMDFTGPFPVTKDGNDMLMVVTDKFTKRSHYIAVKSTDKAPDTAQHFFRNIVRLHGLPQVIISDRDPKFTSHFWKTLFKIMGTKLAMSTAYHPQTDGQTERLNRTIKEMIRHYISHKQDDWDKHLDALEFAYNDTVHSTTGFTPFELDTGAHPNSPLRLPLDDNKEAPVGTQDFLNKLDEDKQLAQASILAAQETQAQYYNNKHKQQTFNVGDKVYISMKHLNPDWLQGRPSKKLNPKFVGPYNIIKQVSDTSYTLDLPSTLKIHPTINIQYLQLANTSPAHFSGRQDPPPAPVIITGEPEYFIEAIEAHRLHKRKLQFLVKWLGYESHDNTWLPLKELKDTTALDLYVSQHPELQLGSTS